MVDEAIARRKTHGGAHDARAEYAAGDEDLRRRIGDLVRSSGDTRLVGIIRQTAVSGGIDKKAGDLTEREGEVALDVYTRRERWDEVFWLLWSLPLKTAVNALDALDAPQVVLLVSKPTDPCVIKAPGDEEAFTHVILPILPNRK